LKISWLIAGVLLAVSTGLAFAQQDKKTDDDQPADPG
jgi:hypothetical protein